MSTDFVSVTNEWSKGSISNKTAEYLRLVELFRCVLQSTNIRSFQSFSSRNATASGSYAQYPVQLYDLWLRFMMQASPSIDRLIRHVWDFTIIGNSVHPYDCDFGLQTNWIQPSLFNRLGWIGHDEKQLIGRNPVFWYKAENKNNEDNHQLDSSRFHATTSREHVSINRSAGSRWSHRWDSCFQYRENVVPSASRELIYRERIAHHTSASQGNSHTSPSELKTNECSNQILGEERLSLTRTMMRHNSFRNSEEPNNPIDPWRSILGRVRAIMGSRRIAPAMDGGLQDDLYNQIPSYLRTNLAVSTAVDLQFDNLNVLTRRLNCKQWNWRTEMEFYSQNKLIPIIYEIVQNAGLGYGNGASSTAYYLIAQNLVSSERHEFKIDTESEEQKQGTKENEELSDAKESLPDKCLLKYAHNGTYVVDIDESHPFWSSEYNVFGFVSFLCLTVYNHAILPYHLSPLLLQTICSVPWLDSDLEKVFQAIYPDTWNTIHQLNDLELSTFLAIENTTKEQYIRSMICPTNVSESKLQVYKQIATLIQHFAEFPNFTPAFLDAYFSGEYRITPKHLLKICKVYSYDTRELTAHYSSLWTQFIESLTEQELKSVLLAFTGSLSLDGEIRIQVQSLSESTDIHIATCLRSVRLHSRFFSDFEQLKQLKIYLFAEGLDQLQDEKIIISSDPTVQDEHPNDNHEEAHVVYLDRRYGGPIRNPDVQGFHDNRSFVDGPFAAATVRETSEEGENQCGLIRRARLFGSSWSFLETVD